MVKLVCDGCHGDGTVETLTTVGRVDPVAYCHPCLVIWRKHEALAEAALATLRAAFARALTDLRADLPLKGMPGG